MTEKPESDDDSYREAFSDIFGEAPEETGPKPPLPDEPGEMTTVDADESGETTDVQEIEVPAPEPPRSWVDLDPEPGERTAALARYGEDPNPSSFVDAELPALPPASVLPGEVVEQRAPDAEAELVESRPGDETRPLSDGAVDEVLQEMERRVRDMHAGSPHDTVEDLVLKKPVVTPPPVAESSASTAELLETWMKRNATQGVHFEPVGAFEPPRTVVRAGAALEIGRTHIRYLELQPYQSGRQVAARYEQVAIAEGGGASVEERLPRIAAALAALRQRIGATTVPCTVLHEQGSVGLRILTMPVGTRAIDAAVRRSLAAEQPLASARRVMGTLRVGNESLKSVLVSYAPRDEVAQLEDALHATGTPVARVTSVSAAFIETVVAKSARLDEDAAEAFVLIEPTALTISLAARAVPLVASVLRLDKEPGTDAWVEEVLTLLAAASSELERACGGGELSRVRYLLALPPGIDFPEKEIVVAFGRPSEVLDVEFLFRVDLESIQKLGVPRDAVCSLVPAAYEATLAVGPTLDLIGQGRPGAVLAAWALVAALALIVIGLAFGWDPSRAEIDRLQGEIAQREKALERSKDVQAEREAVLALRELDGAVSRERAAIEGGASRPPELAALLRELAPLRPDGTFFERIHVVRAPTRRASWDVELTGVGTGDKDRASALGGQLVLRLKQSTLGEVTARAGTPGSDDEYPVAIDAVSGGQR